MKLNQETIEKVFHVIVIILLIIGGISFYLSMTTTDSQLLYATLSFVLPTAASIIEVVIAIFHKSKIYWEE